MPTALQCAGAATCDHSPDLVIPLTVFFGTAAVVFIVFLLRNRAAKTTTRNQAPIRPSVHAEHGHEALGAAVIALMFATMSA